MERRKWIWNVHLNRNRCQNCIAFHADMKSQNAQIVVHQVLRSSVVIPYTERRADKQTIPSQ